MKNLIKTIFLFILCLVIFLPLIMAVTTYGAFQVISMIYILSLSLIFIYPDKLMLKMLNAKEVVVAEKDQIYQFIKHQSFKNSVKSPFVYSYRGNIPKIFLLKGKRGHTLVFEESLFEKLTQSEISSFVNYLLGQDRNGQSYIRSVTNVLALIIIKIGIYIRDFFSYLFRNQNLSKSVFIVYIFFQYPILSFLFWYSKKNTINIETVKNEVEINAVINKLFSLKVTESLVDHLLVLNNISGTKSKMIDMQILELFPSSYAHLNEIYD